MGVGGSLVIHIGEYTIGKSGSKAILFLHLHGEGTEYSENGEAGKAS